MSAPAAAALVDDAPPPRLKLALELEGLSRPKAAVPSESREATITVPATPHDLPPLRLTMAQLPAGGLGLPQAPPRPAPESPVLAVPPARPEPRDKQAPADPPLVPRRPEGKSAPDEPSRIAQIGNPTPPTSPRDRGARPAGTNEPARTGSDAAVVGDGEFLPADDFDEPMPSSPRPQPAVASPSAQTSSSPRRNWGVAPIRWGGTLSTGLRRYQTEGSPATLQQVYEMRTRANSYIIQPYIALVSGDIGYTLVRAQSGGDGSAAGNNLVGTSISGGGTVSVFPQSRFPFQASLSVADSRSDGSLTDTNTSRRRLALRQDYSPKVGRWNAAGQYDRSELEGDFGTDVVDRVSGSYNTVLGKHSMSANAALSSNRTSSGDSSDFYASGTHGIRLSDAWSLDSSATYTSQDFDFSDDGGASFNGSTSSAQVFSFANWTPEDTRWRGNFNGRYFQTKSSVGGGTFTSRNFGGAGSLSFQATRNLSMFGTLGVNWSGEGQFSSSQSVGLSYTGDPINWGPYTYSWHGSTSFGNAVSSNGSSQRSGTASLGHSLHRNWILSELTQMSASVNESVSMTRSVGVGSVTSRTLTHTGSVSLQASPNDEMSGFISASASDNRSLGESKNSFQLFNLQLSGRWRINAYSELNSNLTWQVSNQKSEQQTEFDEQPIIDPETGAIVDETQFLFPNENRSRTSSISGNLGYVNLRALGVRGLRYTLDFRADTSRTRTQRRFGDPDAERESPSLDLDQRLKYRIGRLDTELQYRVAKFEDRRNSLIFLRVSRDFGAF